MWFARSGGNPPMHMAMSKIPRCANRASAPFTKRGQSLLRKPCNYMPRIPRVRATREPHPLFGKGGRHKVAGDFEPHTPRGLSLRCKPRAFRFRATWRAGSLTVFTTFIFRILLTRITRRMATIFIKLLISITRFMAAIRAI